MASSFDAPDPILSYPEEQVLDPSPSHAAATASSSDAPAQMLSHFEKQALGFSPSQVSVGKEKRENTLNQTQFNIEKTRRTASIISAAVSRQVQCAG